VSVPLVIFAVVVLIVAITHVTKIRDLEVEVHSKLQAREMEHQRKMRELELELERIKQGV
jgi:predicted Holliday junction resolvase-like endonuclease